VSGAKISKRDMGIGKIAAASVKASSKIRGRGKREIKSEQKGKRDRLG
jgi:hypothetical protein